MERMTRRKDEYPCRIDNCVAEEWFDSLYNAYPEEDFCKYCPFEKYINRLADLEDYIEMTGDDGK